VVAPARQEGFGLVPLEAMASGTPVIAARAGAAAELILDGVTGRLVPAGDLDALTGAIEWLVDMPPGERAELEIAARRHVEAHHSIEREARAIQAVYDRLLGPAVTPRKVDET
jgi:mannosyltransferase